MNTPITDAACGHALGIVDQNLLKTSRNLEIELANLKAEIAIQSPTAYWLKSCGHVVVGAESECETCKLKLFLKEKMSLQDDYKTVCEAVERQGEIIARLRGYLADPPIDVQESVIKKLNLVSCDAVSDWEKLADELVVLADEYLVAYGGISKERKKQAFQKYNLLKSKNENRNTEN